MFYATGQWHCDDFDRFFIGLPPELQTARALMIISSRVLFSITQSGYFPHIFKDF